MILGKALGAEVLPVSAVLADEDISCCASDRAKMAGRR
uniref:Uncharacterized protein n=2 Tax=Physcomitrium patens TaxID=3218 RepID=A0A2K1JXP5_PHYPA|nr:hypothetical protein PHYPA_013421 [Physcomitrium patens]